MAQARTAEVALAARDLLGESPWWDAENATLVRVDIAGRAVLRWTPATGATAVRELPDEVSLALPRARDGYVACQVDRVVLVGADGRLRHLAHIDEENPHTRLNDGTCDGAGRLWVGTYSTRGRAEGGLYVVTSDGQVSQVLEGQIASNGTAWSPDDAVLYVVDTGRGVLESYGLVQSPSGRHGGLSLGDRTTVVTFDPAEGRPDGISLDVEGGIWVALWGGSEVRRYAPDGSLDRRVVLPVTHPTAVTLGGADLSTAYVTSTRRYAEPRDRRPHGAVLTFPVDLPGQPVRRFAG